MQIIVLGMHRAGTSLTTRIINMMGAYFAPEGKSLGYNKDNPKGFWERRDVMELNDSLLGHFNCTWDKVDGFDDTQAATLPQEIKHNIKSLVMEMDAHRPWVLKDPRLCLTLPYWLPALEVPVAVIARRHPLEIAQSLHTRNQMPIEQGLALWEYHAVQIIRHAHKMRKVFVGYNAMVSTPVKATQALYRGLEKHGVQGLRMPMKREILAFVEPKLHRSRKTEVTHALSKHQETLVAMLAGKKKFNPAIKVSEEARKIMSAAKPL